MTHVHDQELDLTEPAVILEVEFSLPDAGWIYCRGKPLHHEYAIYCTHIYDPFKSFIAWLEQIAAGADAATWAVCEEGSVSRLQFYSEQGPAEGDEADFLLGVTALGHGRVGEVAR